MLAYSNPFYYSAIISKIRLIMNYNQIKVSIFFS